MAHRKAGGTARNLRDSQPKYLGVKIADGQTAKAGSIIVRQRGTNVMSGPNTRLGKDHTIHAVVDGIVKFKNVAQGRNRIVPQIPKSLGLFNKHPRIIL